LKGEPGKNSTKKDCDLTAADDRGQKGEGCPGTVTGGGVRALTRQPEWQPGEKTLDPGSGKTHTAM